MKIAGVLLFIMIIFLNAAPCCWDTCEEDVAIGHGEETSGWTDTCSPFLSCGSCSGFVLQQEGIEFSTFSEPFDAIGDQEQERFQSDYSIRIWQPPKEV